MIHCCIVSDGCDYVRDFVTEEIRNAQWQEFSPRTKIKSGAVIVISNFHLLIGSDLKGIMSFLEPTKCNQGHFQIDHQY
jgi:hypothetical protein